MNRFPATALIVWMQLKDQQMNVASQYLLVIALSAAMSQSLQSRAKSNVSHCKNDEVAPLDKKPTGGANEEKWERDPAVFSRSDRDAIRNYYLGAASHVPLDRARHHGPVPTRRHLYLSSVLPVGSRNVVEPLPGELERRLRPLYSGYSRGTLGKDVVLIDDRTRRVKDVVWDVKKTGR